MDSDYIVEGEMESYLEIDRRFAMLYEILKAKRNEEGTKLINALAEIEI